MNPYDAITSDVLTFADGHVFSTDPLAFFYQLYVPNINRNYAENILLNKMKERKGEKGIFILRNASRPVLDIPKGMNRYYSVSYWGDNKNDFIHVFICCDSDYCNWHALKDIENHFISYSSLRLLLEDLNYIHGTLFRNAIVQKRISLQITK